jgi:hypothetical protein
MSAPIGPGDWVCIASPVPEPQNGEVHQVVSLISGDGGCKFCGGDVGATLANDGLGLLIDSEGPFAPWCICELRPLGRGGHAAGLIEQLKQPAPEAERDLITAD